MQGKLNIGDKLPTERHLSETLALSRNTVRDAIRIMSSMGLVESRQGSGNYLSNKISRNISATVDFIAAIRAVQLSGDKSNSARYCAGMLPQHFS